jgi:hypothetical protein
MRHETATYVTSRHGTTGRRVCSGTQGPVHEPTGGSGSDVSEADQYLTPEAEELAAAASLPTDPSDG